MKNPKLPGAGSPTSWWGKLRRLRSFWWMCAGLLLVLAAALLNLPKADSAQRLPPPVVSVSLDPQTGLPVVLLGGAASVSGQYFFWGPDWSHGRYVHRAEKTGDAFQIRYSGQSDILAFTLQGSVGRSDTAVGEQLQWEWNLNAGQEERSATGGGFSMNFNLAMTEASMGRPELLPNKLGWRWGKPGGPELEFKFDKPLAAVYFEGGRPNEIRLMFYQGKVNPGPSRWRASLKLSGGSRLELPLAERVAPIDDRWSTVSQLSGEEWPIDLRFLNASDRPAGQRGRIQVRGEQFVYPDGSPVRFWGTNISAYALFNTSEGYVRAESRKLAAMGYNLVRLHHHDSTWVQPNIFGRNASNTRDIDENSARRLDYWIKCLRDEGIYIWLDLQVGREFTSEDGIDDFAEIAKNKPRAPVIPANYFNASIAEAMRKFARDYLTRKNSETGLRAVDDPAIAFIQISNENDLTGHYGNRFQPQFGMLRHEERFRAEVKSFSDRTGLSESAIRRTWDHGPAKYFLNEMEQRFHQPFIEDLRKLGVKALVSTTSTWGNNPQVSLPALSIGDYIDVHAYDTEGWLERNPLFGANFMHWLQAAQVLGKPTTVSEWSTDLTAPPDRHTWPIYAGAMAAHQGIAAMLHFNHMATGPDVLQVKRYEAFHDPSLALTLPMAALAFRQGLVTPARSKLVWSPGERLFEQPADPVRSPGLRSLGEIGALRIALPGSRHLPWLKASPAVAGTDKQIDSLQASALSPDANEVLSDTGQLWRNWREGRAVVDAPAAQMLTGWTRQGDWKTADLTAKLEMPLATLSAMSLDGQPLPQAGQLLLVVLGNSQSVQQRLPWLTEPLGGWVQLRSTVDRVAWLARTDGTRKKLLLKSVDGQIRLYLAELPGEGGLAMRLEKVR